MKSIFKNIKRYFSLQFLIQREILETLASICRYIDWDGHFTHNPYTQHMQGHYINLLELSRKLNDMERDCKC